MAIPKMVKWARMGMKMNYIWAKKIGRREGKEMDGNGTHMEPTIGIRRTPAAVQKAA
jgi:hypothetical protein